MILWRKKINSVAEKIIPNWKIRKNPIGETIIPKMPELKEFVGKPYNDYVDAMKQYEKTMSEFELPENNKEKSMSLNFVSIIKTIIIALSIIISSCIVGYAYYESNRYWIHGYGIIDKYNGTVTKLNLQE